MSLKRKGRECALDCLHLLILGSPRSGTTLLASMLGCHPDISILNEDLHGGSLRILSKRVRGVKLCVPNQIELIQSRFDRLADAWITELQKRSNVFRGLAGLRTPTPRGRKSVLSIRDYQRVSKNLHVLGILRNPSDVVRSIKERGEQSTRVAEYRWTRFVNVMYEVFVDSGPSSVTLVAFDRLVTSPDYTLRAVLKRIDCDYHPAVLEGYRHTPQYRGSTEISSDKAGPALSEVLRSPVFSRDAELERRFLTLLDACV